MIKNKKEFTEMIVAVVTIMWVVFSVGFIIQDTWNDFKVEKIQEIKMDAQSYYQTALAELRGTYADGQLDAVNALMQQSTSCEPINLSNGEVTMQFINLACLQQEEGAGTAE